MLIFEIGTLVTCKNKAPRTHLKQGVVRHYDANTEFYRIEFLEGPPWRGEYLATELEKIEED